MKDRSFFCIILSKHTIIKSGGNMKIGLIGLGKMGLNLALNMKDKNHQVIVYNRSPEKTREAEKRGLEGAYSLQELITKLAPPRVVWLMISAGAAVDEIIASLEPLLD
ncbi:MAG: NAD(P)-binding domain-containing protein, partial [Bacilli bacterium]